MYWFVCICKFNAYQTYSYWPLWPAFVSYTRWYIPMLTNKSRIDVSVGYEQQTFSSYWTDTDWTNTQILSQQIHKMQGFSDWHTGTSGITATFKSGTCSCWPCQWASAQEAARGNSAGNAILNAEAKDVDHMPLQTLALQTATVST